MTQEETVTRPAHRPSKYDKEYCNLVRIIRSQGYSLAALRSHLGISKDTFYRWKKEYPEFGEAVELSDDDSQAFYERTGKRAMLGEIKIDSKIWKEMQDRQHGSVQSTEGNKTEINIGNMNVLQQLSNEELQKKIEAKMKNLNLIPTQESDES